MSWRIVRRVGIVVVLAAVLYYVVTFVQVWWAARHDDTRPSEAVVVLGAAQFNGRPSAVFRARLDHAADLYHEHVAPLIVVTGGKQIGGLHQDLLALIARQLRLESFGLGERLAHMLRPRRRHRADHRAVVGIEHFDLPVGRNALAGDAHRFMADRRDRLGLDVHG